ncbi:MAG: hypothetical protein R3F14_22775 [Polyangiaceae bacterium]
MRLRARRSGSLGTGILTVGLVWTACLAPPSIAAADPPAKAPPASTAAAPQAPPASTAAAPQAPPGPAPESDPASAAELAEDREPVPSEAPPPGPEAPFVAVLVQAEAWRREGRYPEAARDLTVALQTAMYDARVPRGLVARMDADLREARSHVGGLSVTTSAGLAIRIDGASMGTSPMPGELLLVTGKHRVIVDGPACLGTADVEIKAGDSRNVTVECAVDPVWRKPSVIVGASLSGATLLVASVMLGISEQRRGTIAGFSQQANGSGFVESGLRDAAIGVERERVDLLNGSITAFLVGGGLLAATGAVFFAVKPKKPEEPAPLAGFSVGPAGGQMWMRW